VSDVDQLQEVGVRACSGVHAKVSVVQQPQRLKVCLHDLVAGLLQYLATSGLPGVLSRLKPAPGPGVPAIRGAARHEPAGVENDAARGAHKVRWDLPPLAEVPDQSQAQGAWPAHLHWADTPAPCCRSRDPLIERQGAGHTRQGRPERRSAGLAPFGGQEPGRGHQRVKAVSTSKTSVARARVDLPIQALLRVSAGSARPSCCRGARLAGCDAAAVGGRGRPRRAPGAGSGGSGGWLRAARCAGADRSGPGLGRDDRRHYADGSGGALSHRPTGRCCLCRPGRLRDAGPLRGTWRRP